jgi:hypothetical protein
MYPALNRLTAVRNPIAAQGQFGGILCDSAYDRSCVRSPKVEATGSNRVRRATTKWLPDRARMPHHAADNRTWNLLPVASA